MSEHAMETRKARTTLVRALGSLLMVNTMVLIGSLESLRPTGWDRVAAVLALASLAAGAAMGWSNRRLPDVPWFARPLVIGAPIAGLIATIVFAIVIPNGLLPHGMVSYGRSDVRVRRTSDQSELARIAADTYGDVALRAVEKLSDQRSLLHIALDHEYASVRRHAVARLSDQSALAKVVLETDDSEVFYAAKRKLTDVAILGEKEMWVNAELTRRVTDQKQLSTLAAEAIDYDVRKAAVDRLTDQEALAKVAVTDESEQIRKAAVERLTDATVLTRMGMWVRPELTRTITDETLRAKLAIEAKDPLVRAAAVEKLSDQPVLERVVDKDKEPFVRRAAVERLSDQATLTRIATSQMDKDLRTVAVGRVSDETVLLKLALEDSDPDVRQVAVGGIASGSGLARVISEAKFQSTRVVAINRMTDQTLLRQLAERDPQTVIRRAAVARVTDDAYLVLRLRAERSASVREAIVARIQGEQAVRHVAMNAYYQTDRDAAVTRLRSTGRGTPSEVAAAQRALAARVKALALDNATDALLQLTVDGEFDVIRAAAAARLTGATLEQAAMRSSERGVLKLLLARLDDSSALSRIAAGAADPAMRLAALHKSGSKSWPSMFEAANANGSAPSAIGDVVAAVSLFADVQADAVTSVTLACIDLIRRGDETRIPEMVDLLNGYGDKTLAEDYLNSGHLELAVAGRAWAGAHGLNVKMGGGSSRAQWGGNR